MAISKQQDIFYSENKMTFALADNRISNKIKRSLELYADTVLLLPPLSSLPQPVASHPDMLIWCHGSRIVTFKDYLSVAKSLFDTLYRAGFEIIPTEETPLPCYPNDIHLNCATVGDYIIGNKKYISKQIADIAEKEGLKILHTNQGYAKCSTLTVSKNAIITADTSVTLTAKAEKIHALKIRAGFVGLDGYDTGFIGGATGVTDKEVLFCGRLDSHPDGEIISRFCLEHGKAPVSLCDEPIYDYGTVMILDEVT